MREKEIKIQDLYEGAYLLCQGFRLERMLVSQNGKAAITFVIAGDGVGSRIEEFRSGRATANIALFTFALEKLKDQMFTKLREQEKRKGRNTHHDNRRNQAVY